MANDQAAVSARVRSEEQVRGRVRAIILELSPNPEENAGESAQMVEGLGYHSLALLELAFTLEDDFELAPIDEQTARRIITVKDVQDHVVNELRSAGRIA